MSFVLRLPLLREIECISFSRFPGIAGLVSPVTLDFWLLYEGSGSRSLNFRADPGHWKSADDNFNFPFR